MDDDGTRSIRRTEPRRPNRRPKEREKKQSTSERPDQARPPCRRFCLQIFVPFVVCFLLCLALCHGAFVPSQQDGGCACAVDAVDRPSILSYYLFFYMSSDPWLRSLKRFMQSLCSVVVRVFFVILGLIVPSSACISMKIVYVSPHTRSSGARHSSSQAKGFGARRENGVCDRLRIFATVPPTPAGLRPWHPSFLPQCPPIPFEKPASLPPSGRPRPFKATEAATRGEEIPKRGKCFFFFERKVTRAPLRSIKIVQKQKAHAPTWKLPLAPLYVCTPTAPARSVPPHHRCSSAPPADSTGTWTK